MSPAGSHQITIESILLICLRCSNPPAPANTSQVVGFDTVQHHVFHKTTASGFYFSQKPFVFGQDPATVLHRYV